MIAHLTGTIKSKHERSIVLDVNGVGYLVNMARAHLERINDNEKISLHIHTHIREDDISLYGFSTEEEWRFFELLLTVSGVGPRVGLEILNAPIQKVKTAIAKKDSSYLTTIPGIGKKTAERIIVDLESKMKETAAYEETSGSAVNEDIIKALMSFGYHRQQVLQGLKKIPSELTDEETIIKYFLQNA